MTGPVTALLLVDLQRDYLERPGLVPAEEVLVPAVVELLTAFRDAGLPIAHVRTITAADGSDAMPHWRTAGRTACVDGSPGAQCPPALAERPGEMVAVKQHYSGFADARLDPWLRDRGVEGLIVAGLYTHACVRETVLDAYQLGYDVAVASGAVGTDDVAHADATRAWLTGRAACFVSTAEVLVGLGLVAPAGSQVATGAAEATEADVDRTVRSVALAQPGWADTAPAARADLLHRWADLIDERHDALAAAIVEQVAKPIAAAQDEVRRAAAHVRVAAGLLDDGNETVAPGVRVRRRPVGVIGAITPWNNPVALPAGKIAPALALGNGVVLKPAPEGAAATTGLVDALLDAGAPPGLVGVVNGGARTGSAVAAHPGVDAVVVTGSVATGRLLAARCGSLLKPLQAELGGNNAAIVLADADLDAIVPALVRGAFAYSGQRCTAIRRLVVEASILDAVVERATAVLRDLVVGDPRDPGTDLGPLISVAARDRVRAVVEGARREGALVRENPLPRGLPAGAWLSPCLIVTGDRSSSIVQDETFGPVLVVQPADGLDDALEAANGVGQGLIMAICTDDASAREAFRRRASAGILQFGPGPLPVHPEAPFGGWKDSGLGPPEHGRWDVDFMTRTQAVYG